MEPKVTLLAHTTDPIKTLFQVWTLSRTDAPLLSPEELAHPAISQEADELFLKIMDAGIPVAENLDFLFLLENVSISFREQMVRHRIGVHVGERLGVDMVPDLADSTWWSQSMRILDMGKFATLNRYRLPEALKGKIISDPLGAGIDTDAEAAFHAFMVDAEKLYNTFVNAGVPMEEAREVIPLAATHRITWKVNLASLKHIVGKRGCWVLQASLWGKVVRGMVEELATKIHPCFRRLISPPCLRGADFTGCKVAIDNERRIKGTDNLPPCPLYLTHEGDESEAEKGETKWWDEHEMVDRGGDRPDIEHKITWRTDDGHASAKMAEMCATFERLWQRDPWTGIRKD